MQIGYLIRVYLFSVYLSVVMVVVGGGDIQS